MMVYTNLLRLTFVAAVCEAHTVEFGFDASPTQSVEELRPFAAFRAGLKVG